ncbi:MAG: DEAD/DEAH box helicase family protein [Oscillospiraceae bacterium]
MRPNRFQQESIINAVNRLTAPKTTHRYLLADEVGLGKTITAGGIIRRLYEQKRADNPGASAINVGYICANMALAQQNQGKLQSAICFDQTGKTNNNGGIGRISLAYYNSLIKKNNGNNNNSIANITLLTPSTTIEVSSPGTKQERSLAACLLFGSHNKAKNKPELTVTGNMTGSIFLAFGNNIKVHGNSGDFVNTLNSNSKDSIGIDSIPIGDFDDFQKAFLDVFNQRFERYISDADILSGIIDWMRKSCEMDDSIELCAKYVFYCVADIKEYYFGANKNTLKNSYLGSIKALDEAGKKFDEFLKAHNEFPVIGNDSKEKAIDFFKKYLYAPLKSIRDKAGKSRNFRNVFLPEAVRIMDSARINGLIFSYLCEMWANSDRYSKQLYENLIFQMLSKTIYSKFGKRPDSAFNVVFSAVAAELYGFARAGLIITTLDKIPIDIFVADEIQNYSRIFKTIKEKGTDKLENLIELDYVIQYIIHSNDVREGKQSLKHDILLLSATPFRVHTAIGTSRADDNPNGAAAGSEDDEVVSENLVKEEFELITGYLAKNGKEFIKSWSLLSDGKKDALYKQQAECFVQHTEAQSQMMRNINISRVERYLGNDSCGSSTEAGTVSLDMDDVSLDEFFMLPNRFETLTVNELRQSLVVAGGGYPKYYVYIKRSEKTVTELYCFRKYSDEDGYERIIIDGIDKELKLEKSSDVGFNFIYLKTPGLATSDLKLSLEKYERTIDDSMKPEWRPAYLKSTPALLSFPQGYGSIKGVNKRFMLTGNDLEQYNPLFGDNARMKNSRIEKLFSKLFDEERQHLLLFIPPSCPPMRGLRGAFEGMENMGISKRLFFSNFYMVPNSLSALISYEANRRVCEILSEKRGNNNVVVLNDSISISFEDLMNPLYKPKYGLEDSAEKVSDNDVANALYEAAKSLYEQDIKYSEQLCNLSDEEREIYANASPYLWSIYNLSDTKRKSFCIGFYKYMLRADCLRVLAACYPDSSMPLIDKILRYCYDGGIHEVFDEFRFSCSEIFDELSDSNSETKKPSISLISDRHHVSRVKIRVFEKMEAFDEPDKLKQFECDFAIGNNPKEADTNSKKAESKSDDDKLNTLKSKIDVFNTPFRPFCFISTTIGQEGFDFHLYCRRVVHWDLEYNPIKFEQREGRVNRYHSLTIRLNAAKKKQGKMSWAERFKQLAEEDIDKVNKTHGLYPDFILDGDFKIVREGYFLPYSAESKNISEVLKAVGYYRSLLGQFGDDQYEELFQKMLAAQSEKGDKDVNKYFISLFPSFEEAHIGQSYFAEKFGIKILSYEHNSDSVTIEFGFLPYRGSSINISLLCHKAFEDAAIYKEASESSRTADGLTYKKLSYKLSSSWSSLELDFSIGDNDSIHFLFTRTGLILRVM